MCQPSPTSTTKYLPNILAIYKNTTQCMSASRSLETDLEFFNELKVMMPGRATNSKAAVMESNTAEIP